MHFRRATLLTMSLSACLALTTPLPAQAASPFDGVYSGGWANTTMGKGTSYCGAPQTDKKITVADGVFEFTNYSTSTKQTFHDRLPVGADGNFKGTVGNSGEIKGTFTASGMTAIWDVGVCHIKMDFKKG